MMTCDEGRGGLKPTRSSVTSDWTGLRMVCACQDFLDQMSGSQIDASQVDVKNPSKLLIVNASGILWHFESKHFIQLNYFLQPKM